MHTENGKLFQKDGKKAITSDCLCLVITFFSSSSLSWENKTLSLSLSPLCMCFSHCLSCFLSFTYSHTHRHMHNVRTTLFLLTFSVSKFGLCSFHWCTQGIVMKSDHYINLFKVFYVWCCISLYVYHIYFSKQSLFIYINKDIFKNKSRRFFCCCCNWQKTIEPGSRLKFLSASKLLQFSLYYLISIIFFYMVVSTVL